MYDQAVKNKNCGHSAVLDYITEQTLLPSIWKRDDKTDR